MVAQVLGTQKVLDVEEFAAKHVGAMCKENILGETPYTFINQEHICILFHRITHVENKKIQVLFPIAKAKNLKIDNSVRAHPIFYFMSHESTKFILDFSRSRNIPGSVLKTVF